MNVFFVFDDGLPQTPLLTGMILSGITCDSLITLTRGMGLTVCEEPYSIDQWQTDTQNGRLREAFVCGTTTVVTPISKVGGHKHNFTVDDGKAGELATKLKAALIDLQNGHTPDPHSWPDHLF